MTHVALLGIEHLMTGVQILNKVAEQQITFERESASIVRVISDEPFDIYWPVKQNFIRSNAREVISPKWNENHAEWYAKVVVEELQRLDKRITSAEYYGKIQQFTPAVAHAIVGRFGLESAQIFRDMTWDGLNGCWMVPWQGMVLGIEQDGYIHS